MINYISENNYIKFKKDFNDKAYTKLYEKINKLKNPKDNNIDNSEPDISDDDSNCDINENISNDHRSAITSNNELDLHHLSNHPDENVRYQVAKNKNTSPATINKMSGIEKHSFVLQGLVDSPSKTKNSLKSIINNPYSNDSHKESAQNHLNSGSYITKQ